MTAQSCDKSTFSFMKNHETVFQSGRSVRVPGSTERERLASTPLPACAGVSTSDFGCLSKCVMVQMIKNLPTRQETRVPSLGQEDPLEKGVCLFVTPLPVARQASLSLGFSRQEYWSELPFPSPGDFLNPKRSLR